MNDSTDKDDAPLDPVAVRVLGALIEKERTTPDSYPLTLNALVTACNQTSNRDPVLSLDEATVMDSVEELTRRGLVRSVHRSDSRAKRYRQAMAEAMSLHPSEIATMCVLMLRGPQTAGEIRTRTARLFEFRDLAHVDVTLDALMTRLKPLVAQLPRGSRQKEVRFAHLLSGAPELEPPEAAPAPGAADDDRIEALEQSLESLRAEVAELRTRLDDFQREFQ